MPSGSTSPSSSSSPSVSSSSGSLDRTSGGTRGTRGHGSRGHGGRSSSKANSSSRKEQVVNLRLILVSGKTKDFKFPITESAGEIAQYVFDNWPSGRFLGEFSDVF